MHILSIKRERGCFEGFVPDDPEEDSNARIVHIIVKSFWIPFQTSLRRNLQLEILLSIV